MVISQEKLDPHHQKMMKRVSEDLNEYHSRIHQNSCYGLVALKKTLSGNCANQNKLT